MHFVFTVAVATLVTLGSLCIHAEAKLAQVHVLVRHGNRAPNAELVNSCPLLFPTVSSIVDMFGVRPQELTRMGLNQCFVMGAMLRRQYLETDKFLPASYTEASEEWKFQARGETRHQQSLAALTDALFPDGTGVDTYPGRRQPIPYFSWDKSMDTILHPPKPCQACRFRDDAVWSATKGDAVVKQNKGKVQAISDICGFDIANAAVPSGALKDIADGFGFLMYEGLTLPIPNWSNMSNMIVDFSFKMFADRLFGTPEQATYWAGDYPRTVVADMVQLITRKLDNRGGPAPKMIINTVSREIVFGLEYFFGLDFDIPAEHTPKGAMPPGNALIFELHQSDMDGGLFFVRVFNMFPSSDPNNVDYSRQQLTIKGCDMDCPLEDFILSIQRQEQNTGTWRDICGAYTFESLKKDFPVKFGHGKPPGKHAPKPGLRGPPVGEDADISKIWTDADVSPSNWSRLGIKPFHLKPEKAKALKAYIRDHMAVHKGQEDPELLLSKLVGDTPWVGAEYVEHILAHSEVSVPQAPQPASKVVLLASMVVVCVAVCIIVRMRGERASYEPVA